MPTPPPVAPTPHSDAIPVPARSVVASPLLGLPGAVGADGRDAGVAWHYGDPMGEQRAAERRVALFDLSHRRVLTVTGPDRLTWLHTLTSQSLRDLPDGSTTQALLLSPQGHVEHHIGVTEIGGVTYLDVSASDVDALREYLQRMIFWSKVEVWADAVDRADPVHPADPVALAPRTEATPAVDSSGAGINLPSLARLRLAGPDAAAALAAAGVVDGQPEDGTALARPGGGFVRNAGGRSPALDVFVPRGQFAQVASSLIAAGARPAGSWAAMAIRVAARDPEHGLDTDDRTIPNELSWLREAVHLNKGCYRGQETVARVHNIGRPPRRLVLLNLDGSVDRLPEPGSQVLTAQGRVVGRVGTAVQHHELGPVALALVKRGITADVPLFADGVDAAIDPDDLLDESATPAVPRSAIDRRQFIDVRRS